MPGVPPVTVPAAVMFAIPVTLLLHAPPGVRSDTDVVSPEQTVSDPVMPAGKGFTVTTPVVTQPVGKV